ncbi:TetR/AcrR family transcriptional regulator [Mycolicibacterium sp. P9-64]|uniref:TetR/AcrR family transcriptional regulator n=1 Tax=Mycolicibacterium sp. P9-64 TaxID=2024612 RepID=UPI0011ECAE22|nr:TetR/AcrR family transcriptional regulator [Mycolicibacterium sp. P9-64]KAA0082867.1 TetR/AcrR family transcriptional regulator [Mycolicibacterium sp. P9-64]
MVSFVRAHSPEQREVRRTTILDTARAMLDEMPVADITLNGLSRKSCMAKSNVLRYFESREAVLLELCAEALEEWVIGLEPKLSAAMSPSDPAPVRANRIVAVITASLAERPVLCDLMSAQAGVLEHNISTGTVLAYKRASVATISRLTDLVTRHLPELGAENAGRFTRLTALMATSVWTHSHAPKAVVAAYEADPSLQPYQLNFETTLQEALEVIMAGLLSQ